MPRVIKIVLNNLVYEEQQTGIINRSPSSKSKLRKRSKKLAEKEEETKTKKKIRKHKMTEFSYLLQRKCIRMMRRYYKDSFEMACK
mmetsp:Transcript_12897/g.14770  ORF Transcript_12897/g.14770 Transcript_12897/m.14770 type:complete len:86 (-) Transcript_12897:461-718(-)